MEAKAIADRKIYFGAAAEVKGMKELIGLENRSGILRTYLDEPTLLETVGRLVRRNKEANDGVPCAALTLFNLNRL